MNANNSTDKIIISPATSPDEEKRNENPITGAEALMRSLEHQGVTTIFGYPGGSIMPVFDALYDHRNTLNHILVRHEQGATHAAQGYARVSGRVGVCLVTSGPGATNTITGIADAGKDHGRTAMIHSFRVCLCIPVLLKSCKDRIFGTHP